MPKVLKVKQERLWKIRPGAPFPSEVKIDYNSTTGHTSIKPAKSISPERFVKVMSVVVQCFTHFHAGTSLA